jgi:class 3 adenylate cyclase
MTADDLDMFLGLKKGAFSHIPVYAWKPAYEAILKVRKLEEENLFRPGLYYIVLVDLCGSTKASAVLGQDTNTQRIEQFVIASVEALGSVDLLNYTQFVKQVGDAVLFIFSSFDDILAWANKADELYAAYTQEYKSAEHAEVFEIRTKKVVHLGEVTYSGNGNPIALAVNQIFKIEKSFSAGELGCTDVVRRAIVPNLAGSGLHATERAKILLPEEEFETSIWVIEKPSGIYRG